MRAQVSRRQFFISGIAGACAAAVTGSSLMAGAQGSDSELSGLSLVESHDSTFESHVREHYPGLLEDPGFAQVKPLSAFLSNESSKGVLGFSITWQITSGKQVYQDTLTYYSRAGQRSLSKTRPATSGSMQLLPAGSVRLISPYFVWSEGHYAAKKPVNWKAVVKPREPHGFLLNQAGRSESVRTTVDGVVFADHSVTGTDAKKYNVRFAIRRNAEHDEALSVLRELKRGAPVTEVRRLLQDHSAAQRPTLKQTCSGITLHEKTMPTTS